MDAAKGAINVFILSYVDTRGIARLESFITYENALAWAQAHWLLHQIPCYIYQATRVKAIDGSAPR